MNARGVGGRRTPQGGDPARAVPEGSRRIRPAPTRRRSWAPLDHPDPSLLLPVHIHVRLQRANAATDPSISVTYSHVVSQPHTWLHTLE